MQVSFHSLSLMQCILVVKKTITHWRTGFERHVFPTMEIYLLYITTTYLKSLCVELLKINYDVLIDLKYQYYCAKENWVFLFCSKSSPARIAWHYQKLFFVYSAYKISLPSHLMQYCLDTSCFSLMTAFF